jgi:hypothetical protein
MLENSFSSVPDLPSYPCLEHITKRVSWLEIWLGDVLAYVVGDLVDEIQEIAEKGGWDNFNQPCASAS